MALLRLLLRLLLLLLAFAWVVADGRKYVLVPR